MRGLSFLDETKRAIPKGAARRSSERKHAHEGSVARGDVMAENNEMVPCLEPIREVWIHSEAFAASRLSMMRIMARRMNAATVVA